MIDYGIIHKSFVILVDILAIWLAFTIFRRDPKGKLNQIFVLMATSMVGWVSFAYLSRLIGPSNLDLSFLFLRIAWFVTPLLFVFLYFFVIHLIKEVKKYRVLSGFVVGLGVLITLTTVFTDLVMTGVRFSGSTLVIVYGSGMWPFLGVVSFIILATLHPLTSKYVRLSPKNRVKLDYLIVGIAVFYVANIVFNISLPVIFKFSSLYFLGDYSLVFLLIFTALSILKHRMFGIRMILTQLLVVVITLLLLLDFFVSTTVFEFTWRGIMLVGFLILGTLLVKSVNKEVEHRRQLEENFARIQEQSNKIEKQSRQLKRANNKLKELIKVKSEFLTIASHQLRTPLSAAWGFLSMLSDGTLDNESDAEKKKIYKTIYEAVSRLNEIVNDLLGAMEAEGRVIKLDKKPVDINSLIKESLDQAALQAKARNVKLEFKPLPKLQKIVADPKYLGEVIRNLLDNAIKYTPEKKNGTIEVSLRKQKKKLIIKVKDQGIGIPKKEQKQLFDQFKRASNAKSTHTDGSGLGLYIAKKVMLAHSGSIKIFSPGENKGSVVTLEIGLSKK